MTPPNVIISHEAEKPWLVYGPAVGVHVADSTQAHEVLTGLIMVNQARRDKSIVRTLPPPFGRTDNEPFGRNDEEARDSDTLQHAFREASDLARNLIHEALRNEQARRQNEKQLNHYRVSAELAGLDPDGPHPHEQPPELVRIIGALPGVESVSMLVNDQPIERRELDRWQLGAYSVMVIVEGGDDTQIAAAILDNLPHALGTCGNTEVPIVTNEGWQTTVRFQREEASETA